MTDGQNRLLNPASRIRARGNNRLYTLSHSISPCAHVVSGPGIDEGLGPRLARMHDMPRAVVSFPDLPGTPGEVSYRVETISRGNGGSRRVLFAITDSDHDMTLKVPPGILQARP